MRSYGSEGAMILRAQFRYVGEPVESSDAASAEARLLALAYAVEAAVEHGRFASVAEVARALGVSRARTSQLMRARWMRVAEQERALMPDVGGGVP
jgi:predicted XRE-type DNA-binding protein